MATYTPVTAGVSSLTETVDGFELRIDSLAFVASHDTRALGVVCFAYGLDHELFDGVDPHSGVGRWLTWHFCALLSRREDDPDLPSALQRALAEACELVPTDEARREICAGVEARLRASEEHHGRPLATLRAINDSKTGDASRTDSDDI